MNILVELVTTLMDRIKQVEENIGKTLSITVSPCFVSITTDKNYLYTVYKTDYLCWVEEVTYLSALNEDNDFYTYNPNMGTWTVGQKNVEHPKPEFLFIKDIGDNINVIVKSFSTQEVKEFFERLILSEYVHYRDLVLASKD